MGSSIGKELERGVEKIAKDPILGPIAQIAVAYYGGPIGSAIYAGLAPEGSSFNTQNALRAGATTAAFNAMSAPDSNILTPRGSITDVFGSGMQQVPMDGISGVAESAPSVLESIGGTMDAAGSANIPGDIGSLERAVASAGSQGIPYPPDPNSYVSGANAAGQYASTGTPTVADVPTTSAPSTGPRFADVGETPYTSGPTDVGAIPGVTTFPSGVENMPQPNIIDKGLESLNQGYNNAVNYISELPDKALDYASELPGKALDYASALPGKALDYVVNDPLRATAYGTMAYSGIQSLREAKKQKEEAERILADQENRKQEEIEWARGVMRDYASNYERLTAEEVARERGMAMGGIASFDDERGSDDELMQGGIASLAKGGLPPRYLQGAGDGMSDSIHARIGGKQEARLADGEFVVPADVVSHLGNGSSNAGAKKLYAMMDRVRNARTGKKRQAPQVKTERYMPA